MTLISDRMSTVVEKVRSELNSAINQMAAYVEQLEKQRTRMVDTTATDTITSLSTRCQDLATQLSKYGMFFGDIDQFVSNSDDLIESIADRFFGCAMREPITTQQAMAKFNRSKSTIYRWIKSGKLAAEKEANRWAIFV